MVTTGRSISLGLLLCWVLTVGAQVTSPENLSLGRHPVYEVSQDSAGKIWMATGNGLYNWTPLGGFQPFNDHEFAFLDVRHIHHLDSGAWVLTTQGLFRLTATHTLIPHGLKDLRENRILELVEDAAGNIWFLGYTQLFLLQPDGSQNVWTLAELGVEFPARLDSRSGKAILLTEEVGLHLNTSGIGEPQLLTDLQEETPSFMESPDGLLRFEPDYDFLTVRLSENSLISRRIPVQRPISQAFQDGGGNIWLSFGTPQLEILPSESYQHLATSMRLKFTLGLREGEMIQRIAGHDHRVAILTTANRLFWCNRLEVQGEWQLGRMEDPEVFLTHEHIVIRDQEEIILISLSSRERLQIKVPGLSLVASSGNRITYGLDHEAYGLLEADILESLMVNPDPSVLERHVLPDLKEVFAKQVLCLPGGEVVVLQNRELKVFQADSLESPSFMIPEQFREIIHWREDTLLGKTVDGKLILVTSEDYVPIELPFQEGGMLSRIAVAPENNLIWLCNGHEIWLSTGISGLISRTSSCLVHVPMKSSSAAWDRYFLGIGVDEEVAVLVSQKSETHDGDIFVRCVRWTDCVQPWEGIRDIPQDSTIFSIEFESTVLSYPFDQTVEVRINDQDWQIAENSTFTLPQVTSGTYKISARLRAGGAILAEKDEVLVFTIQTPFYQSWWFIFISSVMLIGLVWAGLSLYYGENERKRLELQVRDRTRDLDRSVNELRQKNEDLEQFAYIASHDLKSPLRGVIGHLQLFQRKYEDQIDQSGKDSINFAISESKRLYEMVNDLLDFASVGSGKMDKRLVAMNKLLTTLRQSILLQRRDQPGEIILDHFPQILVVPSQFEALFRNLIENGLKFNESSHPKVTISYQDAGERHQFRVADNGIGIERKYIEKAFELYGRLNPDYPGTGIGLAICRRVVERHGGLLTLEKSDESGSVFLISLPKDEEEILA